jgi:hypothetical protein
VDDSPRSQKLIEDYLLDIFHLQDADGKRLKPDWVGMKLQVDMALIYREVRTPGPLTALTVDDQTLTETHDGQVNTVNVTIGNRTRTAVFTINDPPQRLSF